MCCGESEIETENDWMRIIYEAKVYKYRKMLLYYFNDSYGIYDYCSGQLSKT